MPISRLHSGSALIGGCQDQQTERQRSQGEKSILGVLLRVQRFEVLHYVQLCAPGVQGIDDNQITTEMWLKRGRELRTSRSCSY
jgi:hypothetical protein